MSTLQILLALYIGGLWPTMNYIHVTNGYKMSHPLTIVGAIIWPIFMAINLFIKVLEVISGS